MKESDLSIINLNIFQRKYSTNKHMHFVMDCLGWLVVF